MKGFGIQLRHDFSRKNSDRSSFSANHNRICNNFVFNCGRGAISLLPDVPGATDNYCDENVFGDDAAQVRMRFTTEWMKGLVPFSWDKTAVGKALGISGNGNITVPYAIWQEDAGQDKKSVIVNRTQLFPECDPERIMKRLVSIWSKESEAVMNGYGKAKIQPIRALMDSLQVKPEIF